MTARANTIQCVMINQGHTCATVTLALMEYIVKQVSSSKGALTFGSITSSNTDIETFFEKITTVSNAAVAIPIRNEMLKYLSAIPSLRPLKSKNFLGKDLGLGQCETTFRIVDSSRTQ